MKHIIATFAVALLCLTQSIAAYRPSDIENVQRLNAERYTTNPDGILSSEAVSKLDAIAHSLKERGIAEVAIVAVDAIDSGSVFDFGIELFESWGVGDDELDNGLGILLVEDEHEIRFFTGYGIEGVLTDALSVRIQQEYMLPHFRIGDYSTGMVAGLEAVDTLLTNGDLPIAQDDDLSGEDKALIIVALLFILLPLAALLYAEYQQTKCPNCGKHGLRIAEKRTLKRTAFSTTTEQILVCDKCGSRHRRTIKRDNPNSGSGPIIFGGGGGFGSGGGFGGGFGGGSFGGGSFGGGGGGSRW